MKKPNDSLTKLQFATLKKLKDIYKNITFDFKRVSEPINQLKKRTLFNEEVSYQP